MIRSKRFGLLTMVCLYNLALGIRQGPKGEPGDLDISTKAGMKGDQGPQGSAYNITLNNLIINTILETWESLSDVSLDTLKDCFLNGDCLSKWSEWGPLSACSVSCGVGGFRVQRRHCRRIDGRPGGSCPGEMYRRWICEEEAKVDCEEEKKDSILLYNRDTNIMGAKVIR